MKPWRILIAALAGFGVVLQYGLMIQDASWATFGPTTLQYVSYFTMVSNILAAVVLTAPLIAAQTRLAVWSEASTTRIALAVYLTVTAVIYHALLAGLWDPKGLRLASTTILHTLTPAAFLIDWLLRGGQGPALWSAALKALPTPVIYGAWTLIHGALSGFYPYGFLDVSKHGYPAVLATMIVMFLGFLGLALAFTALHRARAKLAMGRADPLSA
jgi:hypothetical protein